MSFSRSSLRLLCVLWVACGTAWADEVVDAGAGEAGIQAAIERLKGQGGGAIHLKAGVYELQRGLRLVDARNIRLVGQEGVRLVMAPQVRTVVTRDAAAGESSVEVESTAGLEAGMRCEAHAAGRSYQSPDGKTHVCPYVNFGVAGIEGGRIRTVQPLAYALPKGTVLIRVSCAVFVSGRTADVSFEKIEIDLNREKWPVAPLNHTDHCGIFVSAAYDYKKGLLGPAIERIRIRDCAVRNAHHRGIAWYGVAGGSITGCRVENTGPEGIDIDHFCRGCEVKGNTVRNCPVAIELNDASECVIEDNCVEECGAGIKLWRWCEGEELNVRNRFVGNRVVGCRGDSIWCAANTSLSLIRGNRIERGGQRGIYVAGDRNTVEENRVGRCGQEAVLVTGGRNVLRGNVIEGGGAVVDRGKGTVVER